MRKFVRHHHILAGVVILALLALGALVFKLSTEKPPAPVTATVSTGAVKQLVSVSGVADAKQSAELAFPVTGTVESVAVVVGTSVQAGDTLATLDSRTLQSDRKDAEAALRSAIANRDELLSGPQDESRAVTAETVRLKEDALAAAKQTAESKIENARRTLLSSGVSAYSDDDAEDAVAPTLSGTYACDAEGTYVLDVYSSSAGSGYSYRLSGLESGIFSASTEQSVAMGLCGLRIVFDEDSSYNNTRWFVEIPNTKSATYTSAQNAYTLAVTEAKSTITLAEQELALAQATAGSDNAPARSEAIARANATVAQAEARLERALSEIADRTLIAPFAGVITHIDIAAGETVSSEPVMTLLSAGDFEIKARIPEIDIGKLQIGQRVEMVFDAESTETIRGAISFISLKATEIDGVSYYEAYIQPDTTPSWLRSGLNADIDIIFAEVSDSLRIPKRFVIWNDQKTSVLKQVGEAAVSTPITVTLDGTDGFVAITGLNEGDTVVAP